MNGNVPLQVFIFHCEQISIYVNGTKGPFNIFDIVGFKDFKFLGSGVLRRIWKSWQLVSK
jgi:hypothetical protein